MARISNALLCANQSCALPRRHLDGCANQTECRGCQPAQAADGILLCRVCLERLAEAPSAAAKLYTELVLQLRRQGRGEQTTGSRDRSPGVDNAVLEARTQIAETLRRLARLIHLTRGFALPTRMMVDRRPEGFIGPLQIRPYADTSMEALAEFVARSAEWLAARPDAGQHAADLRAISHGKVWALAYPAAKDKLYIGRCPTVVTFIAEDKTLTEGVCEERLDWDGQTALITCPGCEKSETVEWWQREIVGETGGIVDTVAAAAWLSLHWYRDVRPSVVANWASRLDRDGNPKLRRHMTTPEDPDEKPKPIRDDRGRQLYKLEDIKACAQATWGAQPELRPRKKVSA